MLAKCKLVSYTGAELAELPSDVWSIRPTAATLTTLPVLTSASIFSGIYSLRYGPPAVVSVVGQLQPLVHGRAGLPRPPPSSPPCGGSEGANRRRSNSTTGHDSELTLMLLQQRRLSHSHASTSTNIPTDTTTTSFDSSIRLWNLDSMRSANTVLDAAAAAAAAGWTWPSRSALLRSSQQLTPAQAAVQLLRIANLDVRGARIAKQQQQQQRQQQGQRQGHQTDEKEGGVEGAEDYQPPPLRLHHCDERCRSDGPPLPSAPQLTPTTDQLLPAQPSQTSHPPAAAAAAAAAATVTPPMELLAAGLDILDHWALREAMDALQPRLQQLSATQLQRCLETLVLVRHPPTDPWFHEWLLASERQLQAADATEVYGMLVAMRALRQRPQSQEWIKGAMKALSGHLSQLDAGQVVELLGSFVDLALRPPDGLLNRIFALLLPDLSKLQPGVVLNLLSSCTRLRVAPPSHVLSAAFSALTPAALAGAPPAALCRLAAALAALRLQLPLTLLTALVGRADVLLRSTVAAATVSSAGDRVNAATLRNSCSSGGGIAAAPAELQLGSSVTPGFPPAALGATAVAASGKNLGEGEEGATRCLVDAGTRILRPRSIKARRTVGVASPVAVAAAAAGAVRSSTAVAAEGSVAQVQPGSDGSGDDEETAPLLTLPPGTSTVQPAASTTLTGPQLSRLLRDLRVLEAPLPADWGDLCGHVLMSLTTYVSSTSVADVSYLLRTAARCGLALPLGAVRFAAAGLEASLRASAEARRRMVRQRQRMMRGNAAAAATELAAEVAADPEDDNACDWGYVMGGDPSGAEDGVAAAITAAATCGDESNDRSWYKDGGGDNGGEGEALSRVVAASGNCGQPWTPKALSVATTALVPYAAHLPSSLLHALYDNLYDSLERFDLPELTATLHALPRLLTVPSPRKTRLLRRAAATAASTLPPPPPPALVMSYLSCLYGRMHRMQPWQLSMCMFSLLRLGARPEPAWMDAFLGQVYRKLPYMNEVQVATVPWVVAKMSYRPQAGWVDRVLSAAAARLSCFSPRHLSQLLWAVAAMGYRPGSEWMARWLDKARVHFRTSDGRTLAALAWAVAFVEHRPGDKWLQDLCEHLARRLPYTSPRAVANTLAALAALGHRPDVSWMNAIAEHVRVRLPPPAGAAAAGGGAGGSSPAPSHPVEDSGCYSLQDLSHVCYSLARLGYNPSGAWLDAISTAAARLALQDPAAVAAPAGVTDAAVAAAAAAHAKHIALLTLALTHHRQGPPPSAWSAFLEGLFPCLPYASPQALAVLLAAAAALRLPLPREHAGALLLATHRRMAAFSNRGLAMVFRGFVDLGVDPGPKWLGHLEEVLRQRALLSQQQQQLVAQKLLLQQRLRQVGRQQQQPHAVIAQEAEEWEEERGSQEDGEQQQQQREKGLRDFSGLAPRERVCMLWAAVTLETAEVCLSAGNSGAPGEQLGRAHRRLRGGDHVPARRSASSLSQSPSPSSLLHSPSRHRQQQQQQQPSASAAMAASAGGGGGMDGGYPSPPRWVRKLGPVQRPFRLAGLLTLLLSCPEQEREPTAEEGRAAPLRQRRRYPDRHGPRRNGGGGDGGEPRHPWSQLSAYTSQDLAMLCWALGRLRLHPHGIGGGLVAALLTEVSYRLAAETGAGAATVGEVSASELAAAADAVTAEADSPTAIGTFRRGGGGGGRVLAPSDLALTCWGLSSLGMWPTVSWQATVAATALRFARESSLSARDFATVLAALARWRRKPRVRQALLRRLRLGPLQGHRRLRRRPRARDRKVGSSTAEVRLRACTAALAELSLADSAAHMPLVEPPPAPAPLLQQPQSTTAAQADGSRRLAERCYDARSLASLTWALASLGVVRRLPDPWVTAFMPVSLHLLSQLPPSYRVTLLDSLSRLGLRPGAVWLEQAEQVVIQGGRLTLASSYRGLEAALRRMADEGGRRLQTR